MEMRLHKTNNIIPGTLWGLFPGLVGQDREC